MPSGLTEFVANGLYSFEDFAWRCARYSLSECREKSLEYKIPKKVSISPKFLKDYKKACSAYEKALKRTRDQWKKEKEICEKSNKKASIKYEEYVMTQYDNYISMMDKVKSWKIKDNILAGLKNIMIKQLQESIDFDCSSILRDKKEEDNSLDFFIKNQLDYFKRCMDNRKKDLEQERLNIKHRNLFVKKLMETFPERKILSPAKKGSVSKKEINKAINKVKRKNTHAKSMD